MIEYTIPRTSVLDLIAGLEAIVSANPDIDFSKVGATLNSGEYDCNSAELTTWEPYDSLGNTRVCVDLF